MKTEIENQTEKLERIVELERQLTELKTKITSEISTGQNQLTPAPELTPEDKLKAFLQSYKGPALSASKVCWDVLGFRGGYTRYIDTIKAVAQELGWQVVEIAHTKRTTLALIPPKEATLTTIKTLSREPATASDIQQLAPRSTQRIIAYLKNYHGGVVALSAMNKAIFGYSNGPYGKTVAKTALELGWTTKQQQGRSGRISTNLIPPGLNIVNQSPKQITAYTQHPARRGSSLKGRTQPLTNSQIELLKTIKVSKPMTIVPIAKIIGASPDRVKRYLSQTGWTSISRGESTYYAPLDTARLSYPKSAHHFGYLPLPNLESFEGAVKQILSVTRTAQRSQLLRMALSKVDCDKYRQATNRALGTTHLRVLTNITDEIARQMGFRIEKTVKNLNSGYKLLVVMYLKA